MRILAAVVFLVVGLTGCSNPSVVRVDTAAINGLSVSKVFVPRFEGNPEFVEESTDLFVSELESRITTSVVQGSVLRRESTDVLEGGNLAPTGVALASAKAAGAQLLIMGKVTSYDRGATLNGFSTVRVIDVSTGNIVASFHRPSGLLIGYSAHQAVLAAVKRTAEDVAKALE